VRHPENCGKGWALRSAFRIVCNRDYKYAITIDADGQHPPSYLPKFIQELEQHHYDLIIGNRRKNLHNMPFDRKFSNIVTSAIVSLISGRSIPDGQCGFRAYSVEFLKSITLRTYSYETETELLLKALSIGLEIDWIDIPAIYQGEDSHIHRLRDTWKFLRLLLIFIFGGMRERSV
jgi:glycosyltransferase involved in cell wall biosynthesis